MKFEVDKERVDEEERIVVVYLPDGALEPESLAELWIVDSQDKDVHVTLDDFGVNYAIDEEGEADE